MVPISKSSPRPEILVPGGAGYIGSHCAVLLQQAGYRVIVLDNLSNASPHALDRIAQITGIHPEFYKGDIRDADFLEQVFSKHRFLGVMHFAGLKAVGESMKKPLEYYDVNVSGTLTLLAEMKKRAVKNLVFSSSATVYGEPESSPIEETAPRRPFNVYGRTKSMVEDILTDLVRAEKGWNIAALRYFNPVGAHPSGLIGEDPLGIPNNLMPFIAQVAAGRRPALKIWGNDYPTRDGTGLRDYIHVMDLAEGHLAALDYLLREKPRMLALNLGSGGNVSVMEMVQAFVRVSKRRVPFGIAPRRPGDLAAYWASPKKAETLLGWRARRNVEEMCADHWRWQNSNPEGYGT